MKYSLSIFFILIISFSCFAQKRNNVWCFGDSSGIDFNQSVPVPIATSLDTRGSCVSISDSVGNMLFYANTRATLSGNTTRVWSRNNQIMQNGDSVVGRGWYNELVIVPMPDNPNRYYLFSVGVTSFYGFYYSIIDMSLNSGLGIVVQKNIQLNPYKAWDALGAVKHGNGRDWWVITKDYESMNSQDSLHVYLISPTGIQESIQRIGVSFTGGMGNMTFSKDGSRFLFTAYNGLIETMDFNRCTGIFSNANVILNSYNYRITGSTLSPNGNVAYYSNADAISDLVQLDLTASNVWATRDTIISLSHPFETGGSLRLAPDNKIYWSCAWTNQINFNYPYQDSMYHTENMNLSVINNPDVVGSGCNFSLYGFNLGGKRCYWGLPNNPDYDLGPVVGSVCDTLSNGLNENENNLIRIYPNPVGNSAYITIDNEQIFSAEAINTLSQSFRLSFEKSGSKFKIDTSQLPSGIYILYLKSHEKEYIIKFLKI